jgi:hypothetical protein
MTNVEPEAAKGPLWRANRIIRFSERQARERSWISFAELAEHYGRNISVEEGYEQLRTAVIVGEFELNGRPRVLYLHPDVTLAKMTRGRMRDLSEVYGSEPGHLTLQREYLSRCRIPREMAVSWAAKRNVAIVGWLDVGRAIRRRRSFDDDVAVAEGVALVAQGNSCREAARIVVSKLNVKGSGISESTIDRVRRKIAARAKRR